MDSDYEKNLRSDLAKAQKRAADGVAASNFLNTSEGQLIQDWINQRVSYLIESMTGKTPLDDREYLAAHGGIRELKDFNVMLQSKAASGISANEEVGNINEQLSSIARDNSPT